MSQYEALIPSTNKASHRIDNFIWKLETDILPHGVIIATKPLDVNDNCTQKPFKYKGFGFCCTVLTVKLRSREDLVLAIHTWDLDLGWTEVRSGHFLDSLVSLLELVVPLVEVNVENDDRPGRQTSHQESEIFTSNNSWIKDLFKERICVLLLTFGRGREQDFWCLSHKQGKRRAEQGWKSATPEWVMLTFDDSMIGITFPQQPLLFFNWIEK